MANFITKESFERLTEELRKIQEVEIPKISKAKLAAAEEGDLKENAEYIACKEKLELLHSLYENLKQRISSPMFIDDLRIPGHIVSIGTKVKIQDEDKNETMEYKILGSEDADFEKNIISFSSPLAKGLIGKKPSDSVKIKVPEGERTIKVLEIKHFKE